MRYLGLSVCMLLIGAQLGCGIVGDRQNVGAVNGEKANLSGDAASLVVPSTTTPAECIGVDTRKIEFSEDFRTMYMCNSGVRDHASPQGRGVTTSGACLSEQNARCNAFEMCRHYQGSRADCYIEKCRIMYADPSGGAWACHSPHEITGLY